MKSRFYQFFEDDNKILSMSRALMAGAFLVTSFIMVKLTILGGMNEGYFSMYLGAWAGVYLTSKKIDAPPKVENAPVP